MENTRGKRTETLPVDEVIDKVDTTELVAEPTAPATKLGAVCNCGNLNVRKAPSKSSTILKIISKDTKVEVLDEVENGWYKVNVDEIENGFCMKEFIKVNE